MVGLQLARLGELQEGVEKLCCGEGVEGVRGLPRHVAMALEAAGKLLELEALEDWGQRRRSGSDLQGSC